MRVSLCTLIAAVLLSFPLDAKASLITYDYVVTSQSVTPPNVPQPLTLSVTIAGSFADLPTVQACTAFAKPCDTAPDLGALKGFVAIADQASVHVMLASFSNSTCTFDFCDSEPNWTISPQKIFFAQFEFEWEIEIDLSDDPTSLSDPTIVKIGSDGENCFGSLGACSYTGYWVVAFETPEPGPLAIFIGGIFMIAGMRLSANRAAKAT